jgi:phage terminase small subunit
MEKENAGKVTMTPKEECFCYEYVLHLNATKAAMNAQYSKKTARQTGARLLKRAKIQEKIKYLKNNLAEISEISALRVLKEHEKIAFSEAGKLYNGWMSLENFEKLTPEQKVVIQEVTTRKTKYGNEIKIKIYDKQKSLNSINAILGFNDSKKTEITGKDAKNFFADMTDEELNARITKLQKKIELKG